jgi:transcriptional regulator with XRE-family HTH domain
MGANVVSPCHKQGKLLDVGILPTRFQWVTTTQNETTKAKRTTKRVFAKTNLPIELDLDHELRRLLSLNRGQWLEIAELSGVSHSWLSKFYRGQIPNPGYPTLRRLFVLLDDRKPPAPIKRKELPPLPASMPAIPVRAELQQQSEST